MNFYSHAPRGARLGRTDSGTRNSKFLLTRPSRGATLSTAKSHPVTIFLLTRPSRGATFCTGQNNIAPAISTHTPLAGRDRRKKVKWLSKIDFYSHAPRGARPDEQNKMAGYVAISTHTPLAGRDSPCPILPRRWQISTHTPLAGRDDLQGKTKLTSDISTHTPLAGRDVNRVGIE